VPPFASGRIPVNDVPKSTLPHDGAPPAPPLINTLPVATSGKRANDEVVLAYKMSPITGLTVKSVFVPPYANPIFVAFHKPLVIVPNRVILSCVALGIVLLIDGTPLPSVINTLLAWVDNPVILSLPDEYKIWFCIVVAG
jgi:hypothetical protein